MTCLNNNLDILIPYKLPSSGLEEIPPKEIQYCETDQVKMRQTHPIILVITSDFFLLKKKKFSGPHQTIASKESMPSQMCKREYKYRNFLFDRQN